MTNLWYCGGHSLVARDMCLSPEYFTKVQGIPDTPGKRKQPSKPCEITNEPAKKVQKLSSSHDISVDEHIELMISESEDKDLESSDVVDLHAVGQDTEFPATSEDTSQLERLVAELRAKITENHNELVAVQTQLTEKLEIAEAEKERILRSRN